MTFQEFVNKRHFDRREYTEYQMEQRSKEEKRDVPGIITVYKKCETINEDKKHKRNGVGKKQNEKPVIVRTYEK